MIVPRLGKVALGNLGVSCSAKTGSQVSPGFFVCTRVFRSSPALGAAAEQVKSGGGGLPVDYPENHLSAAVEVNALARRGDEAALCRVRRVAGQRQTLQADHAAARGAQGTVKAATDVGGGT